jgi:hypothetical protein
MAYTTRAPYYAEDKASVTVGVAVLLKLEGEAFSRPDMKQLIRELDVAIRAVVGADDKTPIGIALRITERSGDNVAANLILDAAVDCPSYFKRAQAENPTRTVAHIDKPRGDITN